MADNAKVFASPVDFDSLPVRNFVLQMVASAPSALSEGMLIYLSSDKHAQLWDGTAWRSLAFSEDVPSGVELQANKGVANGYAGLDANAKVPVAQLMTGGTTGSLVLLSANMAAGQVPMWDGARWVSYSLSSVMNYCGQVQTYDNLPSGAAKGDTYNVVEAHGNTPAGTNYAWNGTSWDALGGEIDLSGYLLKNPAITPGTSCKVTYDANGLVTGGSDLAASDIPSLDASKIASGVLGIARIPTGNADGKVPLLGNSPTDGQALVYQASTGKYVGATLATGNVNRADLTITGDGTTTEFTLTHNIGRVPIVQILDANAQEVEVSKTINTTQCVFRFGRAPASGVTYSVQVVG